MPVKQLKEFLDSKNAEYSCIQHPPANTAQELAHHAHLRGDQVAKTVVIELDGKRALLVMPATWRIRWDRLTRVLDTDFVELADEAEFKERFPCCEVGAMPPLGCLFGMSVYCCEALTLEPEVCFAAGVHTESIRMRTDEFLRVVSPMVINQGFIRPDAPKPAWLRRPRPPQQGQPALQP